MLLYFGHLSAWFCFIVLWAFIASAAGKKKITLGLFTVLGFSAIMAVFSMLVHIVFFKGSV